MRLKGLVLCAAVSGMLCGAATATELLPCDNGIIPPSDTDTDTSTYTYCDTTQQRACAIEQGFKYNVWGENASAPQGAGQIIDVTCKTDETKPPGKGARCSCEATDSEGTLDLSGKNCWHRVQCTDEVDDEGKKSYVCSCT